MLSGRLPTLGLTAKEKQLLQYIIDFHKQHNYMPTKAEIRDGMGYSHESSVFALMQSLEDKGYIRKQRYKTRGIEILKMDL